MSDEISEVRIPIAEGVSTSSQIQLTRYHRWVGFARRRLILIAFVFGVLIPLSSFAGAANGLHWIDSPWQDERLMTYFKLMLAWPSALPFYGLYGFAAACLTVWYSDPKHFGESFVVRFGIYSGIVLSVQAAVMLYGFPVSMDDFMALVVFFAIVIPVIVLIMFGLVCLLFLGYDRLNERARNFSVVVALIIFAVYLQSLFFERAPDISIFLAELGGMGAPILALLAYLYASRKVFFQTKRPFRFSLLRIMGVMTWVCGYFAAWRGSIQLMMIEYDKLPVENPNCYVSAAAANGHSRLVGSTETRVYGRMIRINRQMQNLKTGELIFANALPRTHRWTRAVYNFGGPPLAKIVRRRKGLASLSYLGIKPFELFVCCVIFCLRIDRRLVRNIYRP